MSSFSSENPPLQCPLTFNQIPQLWDKNTERHRRQITTKPTAENIKSPCLIHSVRVFFSCLFESAERRPQLFLMSFWVYIFLSGLYSLITASSSGLWRQTSKVSFLLLALLLSLWPPSLLVIFWRFWKVLPHSFYKPPLNWAIFYVWLPEMFPLTGLLKTLFICSTTVRYSSSVLW